VMYLGQVGDMPALGDWNNDGRDKVGIFRAGMWLMDYSGNGLWDGTPTDRIGWLGVAGDKLAVGRW